MKQKRRLSNVHTVKAAQIRNDDAAEKKRLEDTKRKQTPAKHLPHDELVAIYQKALGLSAANKINQKNSWDLNLIDHIDEVVHDKEHWNESKKSTKKVTDDMNFQRATFTLDASVKIYSYRVDSVHNETYKVLGGLNRAKTNVEEALDQEENSDAESLRKTTKKAAGTKNTIATPDAINTNDTIEASCVGSDFSLGNFSHGLLLDHLGVSRSFHLNHFGTSKEQDQETPLSDAFLPEVGHFGIPQRRAEEMARQSVSQELDQLRSILAKLSTMNGDEPAMTSVAAEPLSQFDEMENEQDMHDFSDHGADVPDWDDATYPSADVTALNPDMNYASYPVLGVTSKSNYSWFDPKRVKDWAGPSHWKFNKPRTAARGTVTSQSRRKNKAADSLINFRDGVISEEDLNGKGRSSTVLSKAALQKMVLNASSLVLPHDQHIEPVRLLRLFLNASLFIDRSQQTVQQSKYDGSNAQDEFGMLIDHDTDNFDFAPVPEMTGDMDQSMHLIDAPSQPKREEIQFARSSKKVDISFLKSAIWTCMSQKKSKKPLSFKETISDVQGKLPQQLAENATLPFYFICALHLANENGLTLEGASDMSDFRITL